MGIAIQFFTVGGTIDKVYFDRKGAYEVGESLIDQILQEANVTIEYRIDPLLFKDSLDMDNADRRKVAETLRASSASRIVVTHGTDTMIATSLELQSIEGKTIVLTGAMAPARFRSSDAVFNIGFATAAVQVLPPGVYIAMSGRIFAPGRTRKNLEKGRFEEI